MKQIGFKTTDNKISAMEPSKNKHIQNGVVNAKEMEHLQALLELAELIDKSMRKQANSIAVNYTFSEMNGKKLYQKMDKFYTKYYEII